MDTTTCSSVASTVNGSNNIIDYEAFFKELIEGLRKNLGGCEITTSKVMKNNGVVLDAITVSRGGSNVAPTLYAQGFYASVSNGEPFESVLKRFLAILSDSEKTRQALDGFSFPREWEKARDKVVVCLVNAKLNKEILEGIPWIPSMGDLAVTFRLLVDVGNGDLGSILVSNDIAHEWGVTTSQLEEAAMS